MVSVPILIGTALALLVVGAIGLIFGYLLYIRWVVKTGRRGAEAQWAADLVAENDDAFIRAMRGTPQRRLREFGIMADNKEELRKLTVRHYEEQTAEMEDDES